MVSIISKFETLLIMTYSFVPKPIQESITYVSTAIIAALVYSRLILGIYSVLGEKTNLYVYRCALSTSHVARGR